MRIGRLFGTDIYIHFTWFLLMGLFIIPHLLEGNTTQAIFTGALMIGLWISVLGHEFAHILTGRRYGQQAEKITLHIFGGIAHMKIPFGLPETVVAVAGPIFSAILGGLLLLGVTLTGYELPAIELLEKGEGFTPMMIVGMLGYLNIILAVFNLLPIFPMDGGRILRGLITHFSGRLVMATKITVMIGLVVAMPLAFTFILEVNIWTVGIMAFIAFIGLGEMAQIEKLYRDGAGDPNKLDEKQLAAYIATVSMFGPDHPLSIDVAQALSSPEFDAAAQHVNEQFVNTRQVSAIAKLQAMLLLVGISTQFDSEEEIQDDETTDEE